ncbi:MAG: TonB-dependent receptor [Dysgonomonas sp.]|nr:TonB-dependent receptor [Dysgonomonas sp.]
MRISLYRIGVFTALASCLCVDGQSQNIVDTLKLQEVVVTYQANKTTPVTYQNIELGELKVKSVGQEPSFILSETPSITVYSDAGSTQSYSYFRMRGIDQTRINITLDGIPLNEPEDQGAYFSNYPDIFNSLDRVQIQRGIGTTKNGVASYAGSVQLFSPNMRNPRQTTFGLGYGSYNSLRVYGETQSGVVDNKAFYVRLSEVYSDGYKHHSGNHSQSVFASGAWFTDKATWKMNIIAGHQQNDMAWLGVSDSLINIDRRTNANTSKEKDEFTQAMIQLHNTYRFNSNSMLHSAVYYTYLNGNYDFDINNFIGLPSTDEMYNYAFKSNLWGVFSNYIYTKDALKITTGIFASTYNRRHIGSEKTAGEDFRNTGYKKDFSAYAKLDYQIGNFTLFTDLQYRYANFDYKGSVNLDKLEWNFFNPKIGISYQVDKGSEFYYSIGRIGREPTRTDMFGGNEDLLADENGKPEIAIESPEYVVDNELGYRFRNQVISLNANLYYLDFKDEIVLNGNFGPNGLALTNKVEKSYRTGAELSVIYKPVHFLSFINNSSYNYSRIKEQGVKFSPILAPRFITNQEIVWEYRGFDISLIGKYQDKSYIDFANTSTINGYFLMNTRLGYTYKNMNWNIYVNNLTNKKYYNHAYVDYDGKAKYFVQAPTNFYVSMKYTL